MKPTWLLAILISVLFLSFALPATAAEKKTLQDEIIYDLLIDRFFNKGIQNDINVNSLDPTSFSGGDFAGLSSEMQYIKDMGFTMLSIGPVFSTASYDGKEVVDYSQLEPRFGTKEELKEVIDKAHELNMKIIIDLPTQRVNANHVWRKDNPKWFLENEDGTLALDTGNSEVETQLINQMSSFVKEYKVDGIRLQSVGELNTAFINGFSASMKSLRNMYILSDDSSSGIPGLDATVEPGIEKALRNFYKSVDPEPADFENTWSEAKGSLTQVDSLLNSRFTADVVAMNAFPPTRWNLLTFQLFTMPGIPVIQYGSEIAVNGTEAPESHPILDLGVDEELIDHITNLTSLRNKSAALRTGDFEVLHEDKGWLVYKRSNDEDTWIIAINNSSSTQSVTLPAQVLGDDKELRGLFENNIVRQDTNGNYKITLDRELGEAFNVIEQKGFNKAYILALIVLYSTFILFLWFAKQRGKKKEGRKNLENSNS